jgi:glycolate oxidase
LIKASVLSELAGIVGKNALLSAPSQLFLYEYDGSSDQAVPEAVVLPVSTDQVAAVVRLCNRERIPFTARGAGTNLSGGSIPVKGGVVIGLSRLNRLLEIDIANQRAVVEPGYLNLELSSALAPYGYYFAPDPASQKTSTIGGNVGENAGGPHCLKYGVTTNHILGLEVVLPDGSVVEMGGKALDTPGYDLTGLFVGSEGTLGIVTKVIVRIMRLPEAVKTLLAIFETIDDAANCVSEIIAKGILPATLEMMDRTVIKAVELAYQAGYPLDAEAVLIIELDGLKDGQERLTQEIVATCRNHGVREVKVAQGAAERDRLWAGRRGAFGAMTKLAPNYIVNDGTVPRTQLPEVLKEVARIGQKYNVAIGNVFHAGDGNLHPLVLFHQLDKDETERAYACAYDILEVCVRVGGTISGEHGVGVEKRAAMGLVFSTQDMAAMRAVKQAFDPLNLCNPGKVLPDLPAPGAQASISQE